MRYCDVSLSKMCGDLAEKWDVSPDGKTLVFTLKNAKWHDGTPVTADDVDFTLTRLLVKGVSRYITSFTAIKGGKDGTPGAGAA